MSRLILLSVILGTSIILIMLGGLIDADGSKRQLSQDNWWEKRWTPYEAVHCDYIRNAPNCHIYVKPKFFNKEGMSKLAQHFSKWSPEVREGLSFHLFDDRSLLEYFLRSRHEPVTGYQRGFYVRAYGRETLVYKIDKKGDKEEGIRIK